jgi:hypothetical protein
MAELADAADSKSVGRISILPILLQKLGRSGSRPICLVRFSVWNLSVWVHGVSEAQAFFAPLSSGHIVKEAHYQKFGGLRFNVNCRRNEAIRQRIGIATDEFFHTCEVCGQPGTLRKKQWIKTMCDEHDASATGAEQHG